MSHLRKRSSKIATLEAARTIFFIVVGLAIRQSLGLFAHDWSPASSNGPVWWDWDTRLLVGIGYITTALRYSHGISQLYGYERDQIDSFGLPSSSRILGLSLFLALLGILFYLMADNITRFSWFVAWTGLMLFVDFVYNAMSQVVRSPFRRLIRWLPARIFSAIRKKENSWIDTTRGYAADAALQWMTSDALMMGLCLLFLLVWNEVPHERIFALVLIGATVVDYVVNREFYFGGRSEKGEQDIVFVCSPAIGNVGASASKEVKEARFRENIKYAQLYCNSLMKNERIIPLAPHAFYPYFLNILDENDPTDKMLSRYCGLAFLRACDAIYVYVPYTKQPLMNRLSFVKVDRPDLSQLSSGMEQSITEAKKLGLRVKYERTDRLSLQTESSSWDPPVYPPDENQPSLEDLEAIKRIYVCTPFRGMNFSNANDAAKRQILEKNIRAALWYCRKLVRDSEQSVAPFAPQAFYPYFVPLGTDLGGENWFNRSLEILKVCDAVYVYTDDGLPNREFISRGMHHVIKLAEALGIEIKYKQSLPVPNEWKPALPTLAIKGTIGDLPETAVPAGELKTVPTMGLSEQTINSGETGHQRHASPTVSDTSASSIGEKKLNNSQLRVPREDSKDGKELSESKPSVTEKATRPCVYFAGPLFTQSEWQWNDKLTGELTRRGLEVILPQATAYPMLKGEQEFDPAKLFNANILALEKADVVLAVLDQADPDSGTSWECGYAFKLGRPIIGVRTDIRGGGDVPDSSVNLMLFKSCTEFITLPLSQRDSVEWITLRIVEAVHRILEAPSND